MGEQRNAEVYHYAACHDCPRFKWVESEHEAVAAAQDHQQQYQHRPYTGKVPSNAIGYRESHAEAFDG